jgi:hypothetical protein
MPEKWRIGADYVHAGHSTPGVKVAGNRQGLKELHRIRAGAAGQTLVDIQDICPLSASQLEKC